MMHCGARDVLGKGQSRKICRVNYITTFSMSRVLYMHFQVGKSTDPMYDAQPDKRPAERMIQNKCRVTLKKVETETSDRE